jgi:hypothetical protein
MSNIEVWSFYDPIRLGVVSRNPNMFDVVTTFEVGEGLYKWHSIVRDYFNKHAPVIDKRFHQPLANRSCVFFLKHVELGPVRKGASTLNYVLVPVRALSARKWVTCQNTLVRRKSH